MVLISRHPLGDQAHAAVFADPIGVPMSQPRIQLHYPVFPDSTTQMGGCLPNVRGAHACWYFYILAEVTCKQVGDSTDDQIILEGELWMDEHFVQQARSVAMLYELDSPDDFAKFWPYVDKEIARMGLTPAKQKYKRLCPKLNKIITTTH